MKTPSRLLLAILHLGFLAACSRQEPHRSDSPDAPANADIMSHDLGPFFSEETAMYDRMRAAVGTNSADSWARMMIAHHEGGAAISRIALRPDLPPDRRRIVKRVLEDQGSAISLLETLLVNGPPDVEDALIFVEPIQTMHDATMAISGPDAFEVWLRKIIEHHRGAIEMCDVLLRQDAQNPNTNQMVRSLRVRQADELGELEQALVDFNR